MSKIGDTRIVAIRLPPDFDSESFQGLTLPLEECALNDPLVEYFDVYRYGYDDDGNGPDWQPVGERYYSLQEARDFIAELKREVIVQHNRDGSTRIKIKDGGSRRHH